MGMIRVIAFVVALISFLVSAYAFYLNIKMYKARKKTQKNGLE